MHLEDQYRRYAADLLNLASKQLNSADKGHLLLMAEAWLELADRFAQRTKKLRASVDHPLVEHVLGPDHLITE